MFRLKLFARLGDERKLVILKPVIFVPTEVARLVACGVKNLADTAGPVAVLLHELRQRHCAGASVADVDLVIQHTGRFRVQAAEKRRPRRPADRVLAIGSVEGDPRLGQAVEVRRFDVRITGGADVGVEIVANNQQHVRLGVGQIRRDEKAKKCGEYAKGGHLDCLDRWRAFLRSARFCSRFASRALCLAGAVFCPGLAEPYSASERRISASHLVCRLAKRLARSGRLAARFVFSEGSFARSNNSSLPRRLWAFQLPSRTAHSAFS